MKKNLLSFHGQPVAAAATAAAAARDAESRKPTDESNDLSRVISSSVLLGLVPGSDEATHPVNVIAVRFPEDPAFTQSFT